jgi:tetratricopeptide (TPR) repeat protein
VQTDRRDEGIAIFKRAIQSSPQLANPYYGLALALKNAEEFDKAISVLRDLFGRAQMQDIRSRSVFSNARALFMECELHLAEKHHDSAFRAVETFRRSLESTSGFPIRMSKEALENGIRGMIQMAWKHGRDYHLVKYSESLPDQISIHLIAHELTHLDLECAARKTGRNRFFTTTASTREHIIRGIAGDIRRLQDKGYSEA